MTRDEARNIVALRCGRRTDLDATIDAEMAFVQDTILEGDQVLRPWFLLFDDTTLATVIDQETVSLPSTFIEEFEGEPLRWLDTSIDVSTGDQWVGLVKEDYRIIKARFPGKSNTPQSYAIINDKIYLRPTPSAVQSLRFIYFKKDAALTSNIQNNWLKHAADLVIAETGYIVASKHIQNMALAGEFEKDRAIAKKRLYERNEARLHVNRDYTRDE